MRHVYGNVSELAEYLNLSTRQVERLLHFGIIHREKNGKIDLTESIRKYFERKAKSESNKRQDYQIEKALRLRAKRQIAEIELKEIESRMHSAHDVELCWTAIVNHIRKTLNEFPERIAPMIVGKSCAEIAEILTRETEKTLNDLSEYDPATDIPESIESDFDDSDLFDPSDDDDEDSEIVAGSDRQISE